MNLQTILLASVLALGAGAGVANALNYSETGDAGQLPGDAQSTGSAVLTTITGSLNGDGDMFRIFIFDPISFVAATGDLANSNSALAGLVTDPQLHLFDANGMGIMANDDDGAFPQMQARLVGNGILTAGYYYLLITGYDLDPVSESGLIFPSANGATNDMIQGPTGPGGGQAIKGLLGNPGQNEGLYQISLVGASGDIVENPEPATLALVGSGFAIVGLLRRKKKVS